MMMDIITTYDNDEMMIATPTMPHVLAHPYGGRAILPDKKHTTHRAQSSVKYTSQLPKAAILDTGRRGEFHRDNASPFRNREKYKPR